MTQAASAPVFRDFLLLNLFFKLFLNLFLLTNLENIKFQVIRLIRRPQNRMVCCLGPVLHLPEPFVYIARGLTYGFGKQFRVHEMGAGTGGQIAAALYQLHASQVDFAIALDCVFNGISGLCKCRRIQDNHVVFAAFLLQPGKKVEDIGTLKLNLFCQAVEGSVFPWPGLLPAPRRPRPAHVRTLPDRH